MRGYLSRRFPDFSFGRSGKLLADDYIYFIFFVVIIAALYLLLPKDGAIYWSDSARHAMNGAFVLDFLKAMPFRHPVQFAFDYYRQWPALTILFYPPLFYAALAATYAVFGVSEATALLTELIFLLILAWGAFRLSRHWLDPLPAFAAALLLIGAPELAYWGRQIMLDIPAYAFVIWSAVFLVRYTKAQSPGALYAAVVCAVAAVYTKYNAIFFGVTIAAALLYVHGWSALRNGAVLRAAALAAVLLAPIVVVFFAFAHYDLSQADAIPGAAARWSIGALTYYARILPAVLSWPTLALACLYVLALPFVPALRLPRGDALLLIAWVASGYVFYSMIAVKEPRHILFITYPFVLAAILLVDRTLAQFKLRWAVLVVLVGGVWVATLITRPVPYVGGNREAAEAVALLAPPQTNVGFWGSLDGTFIYALRAYTPRRDLGVVRIDKLLFRNVTVYLENGYTQKIMTPEQITDLMFKLHIQYLVVQTGFHDNIAAVKPFYQALSSDKFAEVERIPMTSNYPFPFVTQLVIYRLKADVPPGLVAPHMQIELLGRSL
jgi:4-amino-4-deoxy-L-arabinose transferase-like glycosyltransferase